jgi:hypothetical protein
VEHRLVLKYLQVVQVVQVVQAQQQFPKSVVLALLVAPSLLQT